MLEAAAGEAFDLATGVEPQAATSAARSTKPAKVMRRVVPRLPASLVVMPVERRQCGFDTNHLDFGPARFCLRVDTRGRGRGFAGRSCVMNVSVSQA